MKLIHVASLDYDGCLSAQRHAQVDYYTAANQRLIDFLKADKDKFGKEIILVGSNRQSLMLDGSLSVYNGNGSCFIATDLICKHLGFEFDRFILSDIYLGKEPGFTLNQFFEAVAKTQLQDQVFDRPHILTLCKEDKLKPLFQLSADAFFSIDKINLLYAQMQKVASEHQEGHIVFDFVDDKEEILRSLNGFFRQYPSLMPKNVTLRLFQYTPYVFRPLVQNILNADQTISVIHEIQGTGMIDFDYYQTVKNMGELAERVQPRALNRDGFMMSTCLNPELLKDIRQEKETQKKYAAADALLSLSQPSANTSSGLRFFPQMPLSVDVSTPLRQLNAPAEDEDMVVYTF